jgi:tRNA 2-thiouridine synthesizing protein A
VTGSVVVDARGHRCPVPTLKLRRALETADEVTLLADDPMATIDVPHFARQIGAEVASADADGATFRFVIRAASRL